MNAPALRPRSMVEILDASFSLLKRDYMKFVMIIAIFSIPMLALRLLFAGSGMFAVPIGAEDSAEVVSLGAGLLEVLIFVLWFPFIDAALVLASSDSYLGREVNVANTLSTVFRRIPSVLGVALLRALWYFVGALMLGVGMLYMYAKYFVAPATLMIEGNSASVAMRRSAELSIGSKWKILGTALILGIVQYVLGLLAAIPAVIVNVPALTVAATAVITALVYPIMTAAVTVFYYDMRIRKEGFDIEMMSNEIDSLAVPEPAR